MRDLTHYVGIPFHDKGTDPAVGLDCWQLVRYFYAREFKVMLPNYLALYESSLDPVAARDAIAHAIPQWTEVNPPDFGDVLVFRIMHAPWHTGVCVGGGRMLHIDQGHNSVIESYTGIRWRHRFYGAYRWKS